MRTAPTPMMLLAGQRARGRLQGGADRARAPTRCSAATTSSRKRRSGASWRASPSRRWRGRVCSSGSIPISQHSPGARAARSTQRFFSEGLDQIDAPWFAHMPRMATTRRTLQLLQPTSARARRIGLGSDRRARAPRCPTDFGRWLPLGRDQYVEAHTLMTRLPAVVAGRPRGDGGLDRGALSVPRSPRHRVRQPAAAAAASCAGCARKYLLKKAMAAELPAVDRRPHQAAVPRARQPQLLRRTASRWTTWPNC